MKKNLYLIIFAFFCFSVAQSQSVWKAITENEAKTLAKVNRSSTPSSYRLYSLDLAALKNVLANVPVRGQFQGRSNVIIELPDANGKLNHFRVMETPIMETALAAKYPMIKSYAAQGIEDPTAVARFSVTQFGLHSMMLSAEKSTAYIDPYTENRENYIVYDRNALSKPLNDFECLTDDGLKLQSLESDGNAAANRLLNTDDKKLRTYRLAQSCTAEYGNIFAGTGTDAQKKANIQAQMAITMTRVNGVYENDLAITLVFVANNDAVIYYGDTEADPWDGEYNVRTGITIDANIGFENYDIGHNFNTSGGGNAGCIGCVCSTDTNTSGEHKGTGMTGRGNPTGDAFDIDYVAHEMGHQFGGFHIQSSSGCRSGSGLTEVEPGSGSSIMGYAGICSANVQNNSDAYFGYVNIRDILANVKSGISSSCAQITEVSNNPPTANAGADYVVPKSTPFMLIGTGDDPDGDTITYNWEQNDPESPNTSAAPNPARLVGPMFRSRPATTSPIRYMPNLASILAGQSFNTWEAVPSVGRVLNFSLTVRDNHAGAGQTASDLSKITVSGTAGPFVLTAPNTNVSWAAGTIQTVTWDVAGTNANGVNAKYVDIYLSTDGGTTFPTLLASKVPNDGSELITVPDSPGTQNRIMVRGYDNIFFDLSNTNFGITAPETTFAPAFTGVSGEQNKTICNGNTISYPINYSGLGGFSGSTDFTVSGNPPGSTVTFTPASLNANGQTIMQIVTTATTTSGFYTLDVTATSGAVSKTVHFYLDLFNSDFGTMALTTPVDMAENQGTSIILTWEANPNATSYDVEVASDALFTNILSSGTTQNTGYPVSGLAESTTYFWRILPKNISCSGTFSDAFEFKTGVISCNNYVSTNVPIAISSSGSPTINSTLTVADAGIISDLNVNLVMTHSYVGEITVSLISPSGTAVQLTASACGTSNNINATFDDSGIPVVCGNTPAISGTVIPLQPLALFNGQNANGNWILRIKDANPGDGGSLTNWGLNICGVGPVMGTTENQIRNFVIAPNPSNGSFNIQLDANNTDPVQVGIFDIRGRKIFSKAYESRSFINETIDLNVETGIYLVTVINGDSQETRKIVIE